MRTLRSVWDDLELEVWGERELLQSVVRATWEVMEAMKGVVVDLGTLPPPRRHSVD